jgi:integrase
MRKRPQPDKRRRAAIAPKRADQTPLEAIVRESKRGRTRTVSLHAQVHDALRQWYSARPADASDALFVSLRRRQSAVPEPISAGARR